MSNEESKPPKIKISEGVKKQKLPKVDIPKKSTGTGAAKISPKTPDTLKPVKSKTKPELKKGKLAKGITDAPKTLSKEQETIAKHSKTARISIDKEILDANTAKSTDKDIVDVTPKSISEKGKPESSTDQTPAPEKKDSTLEDTFNTPTLPMDTAEIRMASDDSDKIISDKKSGVKDKEVTDKDDIFNATTIPLSPLEIAQAESEKKEDLIKKDIADDSEIFKATTMPITPVEKDEKVPTPKTVKIKQAPATASMPKTVKLKKNKERTSVKKDTTRVDPPEQMAGDSTSTSAPRKTVKLKRPAMPVKPERPDPATKPLSGQQPLAPTGTEDGSPGTFFSVLALITLIISVCALFFLNKALGIYNSF